MTTSPTRIASPGFKVRSRDAPLRLLSRPITATRCAIGVEPAKTDWSAPTSTVTMLEAPWASSRIVFEATGGFTLCDGPPNHVATPSQIPNPPSMTAAPASSHFLIRSASTLRNLRSRQRADRPFQARPMVDKRPDFPLHWRWLPFATTGEQARRP